ncbi:MAG: hypothetical protein V4515_04565 [Chloroflexota bacterium]
MAKQTGLGDRLYVGGYNLSGDTGSIGLIGGGPTPAEVTGIDVSAFERIAGRFDAGIEWSSWFNPTTLRAHDRYSDLLTTAQHYLYTRGSAIGSAAAGMVGKQPDYSGSRGDDGSLTFALTAMPSEGYGLEWGRLHTAASRTDTTATNGAGVDGVTSSAYGITAYLQVLGLTGTSVTVTLQESSDNGAGDAFAAVVGGAFVAATARGAQRIQTSRTLTVERYLRVVTSGTFTSAEFLVSVVRRAESSAF